jgi:hypothetical protein
MKLPARLIPLLAYRLTAIADRRAPDFIVGGAESPYLLRWYLCPWSRWAHDWRQLPESSLSWWQRWMMRWPLAYLHCFRRSDDDRALHDHPWANCSLLLLGRYVEHTIAAGGVHSRAVRHAGDIVFRRARAAHRVELLPSNNAGPNALEPAWSLFITGFRRREWGFHCPEQGWVHWRRFTARGDRGAIGKGCEG